MREPWIVANVIVGARPEPFFSSCLASVDKAIDFLVLNDNSGDSGNSNLLAFHASRIFKEGRAALLQTRLSDLSGFDEARNLCLRETAKLFPGRNVWILYLDTDEVHTPRLEELTRKFLPSLPDCAAVVDGYFYQFLQSFDFYTSIDRRHNLLFRYGPEIRWEKPIHSELKGMAGKRIPTGYIYFHYGYVYSPENVLRRWKLYKDYDSIPFDPEKIDAGALYSGCEKMLVPFREAHPEALSHYFQENHDMEHILRFTSSAKDFFLKNAFYRWAARVKEMNWRLRLAFRDLQARWAVKGKMICSGKNSEGEFFSGETNGCH